MSVALKVKRMQYKHYRWLCKMSIATIDARFWCAHVESMKATLNQQQLRETERCLRSNCLRMDWRSSTDCCHGNSAGRSWALDQGKSSCLAAFVASQKISLRVIRCEIVEADSAAEEIPEVSRNSHGLRKINDRSSRVGILVRKNLWSVCLLNRLRFCFWQFSRNLVGFLWNSPCFKLLFEVDAHVFRAATPGVVVRFSVLLHEATPETVRGEHDWITGFFLKAFFLPNPLWNSIAV